MNKAAAVKKILFISLSNIGDAILTLPALDFLRQKFPESKITVMAGPRPKELFCGNPHIDRLIVYDKRARLKEKIKLFRQLNKEKFDLVADLRNSFFGAFLSARYRTSPLRFVPKNIRHMKDRHLYRIRDTECRAQEAKKHLLSIKPEDEAYIQKVLEENNIKKEDRIVVVAAGARSHIKRWAKEKFAELISSLIKEFGVRAVLVGDKDDIAINKYISEHMPQPLLDLTGKASLAQAAALLKRARLLITNDSAVLHLGSYLDIPIVALFGPTDELKYGPWSRTCAVVKKGIFCRPCEKAQCRFGTLECLNLVKVEDVLRQVREMLNSKFQITNSKQIPNSKSKIPNQYKRILIARTDRIGDVVLSTPVIQALRQAYPSSYIAMMVSPSAKDIVEGNPYLDEVIIYDKA
ncbi:MAG: glycosyltransferase family 9 protein, partial [Candidatus Omnitrophica bacterium]|nr:glycosyltransferase family 9 protein [Candidatus Omnitrophota bacterium]